MQIKTFRELLMTSPDFATSYIVANNPVAVAERLRALDFTVSGPDEIFAALNELLQEGRYGDFQHALSVPMVTDNMDPAETAVVLEVGSGMARAAQAAFDHDGPIKMSILPDGVEVPELAGPTAPAPGPAAQTNWSNVFGAIASGLAVTLSVLGNQGNRQQVSETPTRVNATLEETERAARTTRYFLVGLSVVGLGILTWLIYTAIRK